MLAVEPSAAMRAQRPRHRAPAIDASAESLPFDDASFDAAMAIVTVHQWSDHVRGLRELRRVSCGPVVILTFDGDALDRFWLADYVPELIDAERGRLPSIARIEAILGTRTAVLEVPIPIDCTDGFTEAFYARPEEFLHEDVRRAQSAWGFVDPTIEARFVEQLRFDLVTVAREIARSRLRRNPPHRLGCLDGLPMTTSIRSPSPRQRVLERVEPTGDVGPESFRVGDRVTAGHEDHGVDPQFGVDAHLVHERVRVGEGITHCEDGLPDGVVVALLVVAVAAQHVELVGNRGRIRGEEVARVRRTGRRDARSCARRCRRSSRAGAAG